MDRDIPNCYDPVYQAERRETELDNFFGRMPVCSCCKEVITPVRAYHHFLGVTLCVGCLEELNESIDVVE